MSCPFAGLNKTSTTFIKPSLRPNPSIGDEIILYGQKIIWTSEHLSPTQLNEWRYLGDAVIDDFFDKYRPQLKDNEDTYVFIEQLSLSKVDHCCDASIIHFPKTIRQRPVWFNKEQIQRGHISIENMLP